MAIKAELPKGEVPEEDLLLKATTGKSYFTDQLHLFEAAGSLVYSVRTDPARQMGLLEAEAGPLMSGLGGGIQAYQTSPNPQDANRQQMAVLTVHHHLLGLGHFAKGFPQVSDSQVETLPYQPPFKQMTEALLQALDAMKGERIIRDAV
jgi:exportin-T